MKKFLILLVLAAVVAGSIIFYDPYLKPYLGPAVDAVKTFVANLGNQLPKKEDGEVPDPFQPLEPDSPASTDPFPAPMPEVASRPGSPPSPARPAGPPKSELDRIVEEMYPMPSFLPLMQIVDNWQKVPERAFPESVQLRERLTFKLVTNGQIVGSSFAPIGTMVKPVRLDGEVLTVANLANESMTNTIHVDSTNFKELIQSRYDEYVSGAFQRVAALRQKERAKLARTPQVVERMAKVSGAWHDPGDPRFVPVKASLAAGEVKAVQLNEAKKFRWNGSEKINGDRYRGTFDTVTVHFEVNTIFGMFPNTLKCLLKDGKVEGWIDPVTEEEKI